MIINGFYDPIWAPVAAAFTKNFDAMGEQGASLALYHRGKPVVHIWAGVYDNRLNGISSAQWQANTPVNIFSAGKGLIALCVLQLVSAGKIDLDAPIAIYWPEFSQAGKSRVTVRQVLCHRSGLSAFNERIADAQIFDWDSMIHAVEVAECWWPTDSAQGYSPFLYGWVLAELVRRVSGCSCFNDYFQQHVAIPLAVDCFFGVPDERLGEIADVAPIKRTIPSVSSDADIATLGKLMKADPRSVTNRAFSNPSTLMTSTNSLSWRKAQIPAANAHCDAKALAAIYGDLASSHSQLLPSACLDLCWQEQSASYDQVLGLPLRFSHGFLLSQEDRPDCHFGRGQRAFGHTGAGGCVGFADPDFELGFGYTTNRMGPSLLIDERAVDLIDAIYTVLGAK